MTTPPDQWRCTPPPLADPTPGVGTRLVEWLFGLRYQREREDVILALADRTDRAARRLRKRMVRKRARIATHLDYWFGDHR